MRINIANNQPSAFIGRILGYAILDIGIAYIAFHYSIDWYLPVILSTLFFAVLELIYQLVSLNKSIHALGKRLPVDISHLTPAISSYIRRIDDKRNELVSSASSGYVQVEGIVSDLLAMQLNTTTGFFYAVSPVEFDMELWSSPGRRQDYIQAQKNAIDRNVEVRRLFVGLALHEIYEEALSQRKAGFNVRFLASANRSVTDMAIFDHSLVYYTDNNGKGRLSTQESIVNEKLTTFKNLWKQAIKIPDTPPDDSEYGLKVYTERDTSFGTRSLLHAWDGNVDTGEFMTPSIADSGYREFMLGLCQRIGNGKSKLEVLSIGAGTGSFEEHLRGEINTDVACIELLPEGVDLLKEKGFEVFETSCTDLSLLKDMKYDLILIDGVIVHLGDISLRKTLRESLKHLKSGGTIIVSSDAPQDSSLRSESHKRVTNGVLRSQRTIVNIANQVGLKEVNNTPTEFPYYRPIRGYTKRAIAVLEKIGVVEKD